MRLDIHNSEEEFKDMFSRIQTLDSMTSRQKEKINLFVKEAQLGKNASVRVGSRRLIANLTTFIRLALYFKKDFDLLTEAELEKFYHDLINNRIRKQNGKPYTNATKNEFLRNLKRYLRTQLKEEDYNKKIRWMKEFNEETEIPALTLEETKKLALKLKNIRDSCLVMFLFDSGARIEEALNLRIRDIEKKTNKEGEEYYRVKIDGTKTKLAKRQISIPLSSHYITEWLENHPAITDKDAFLFPVSYDGFRKTLRIATKELFHRVVTPHHLRHASATHYAKTMEAYTFAYRFGWAFNSNIVRRYIDRSKLGEDAQEELDNVVRANRVDDLEKELEKMKKKEEAFKKITEDIRNEMAMMKDQSSITLEMFNLLKLHLKKGSIEVKDPKLHKILIEAQNTQK